ncbi:MAG: ROK family protein [Chitinophagales bacterium]|nr:ROK family protein [Hyphomicrobiales bacterium]
MSWRLVADIGGTNIRFAKSALGEIRSKRSYPVAQFPSFLEALEFFLRDEGDDRKSCGSAAIGAAGPIDGEWVQLTNAPWLLDAREISAALSGADVLLCNDLEAAALAIPHLSSDQLRPLGGGELDVRAVHRMIAINVGTGFGAATLLRTPAGWMTCPSEAGHMRLSPADFGMHAHPSLHSVEDVLSGRGVLNLYEGLGGVSAGKSAADIFASAAIDSAAKRCVETFTEIFGSIVGNLMLATAAWGGACFYGSVAAGWTNVADLPGFRNAFIGKGPMSIRMKTVPLALVTYDDAALVGLAHVSIPS